MEVAETLDRLLTEGEGIRTQRDLARLLGMRESWVSDILRILTIPAKLQEQLRAAQTTIPYDTVMRIAHADDAAFQADLLAAGLSGEGSHKIRGRIAERRQASPRRSNRRPAMQTFTESCDGYTATVKGPETPDARAKMRDAVRALDKARGPRYDFTMSTVLEKVLHEVNELPKSEQFDLYTRLRDRFDPAADDADSDPAEIEAAWDAELESRVSDIKAGKVELLSGVEFERRTAALFSELGVNRQPRAV